MARWGSSAGITWYPRWRLHQKLRL
jgi:hypothetical protein